MFSNSGRISDKGELVKFIRTLVTGEVVIPLLQPVLSSSYSSPPAQALTVPLWRLSWPYSTPPFPLSTCSLIRVTKSTGTERSVR